jgi:cobalt-zinc-cadmium efflux system outer membrane protein
VPGANVPYGSQTPGNMPGGKPGSLRPRVPGRAHPRVPTTIAPSLPPSPVEAAPQSAPLSISSSILFEMRDEGAPQGLTLEQAIERLVRESITLRARQLEIPQAQADVLTAGLHANPIVYFDKQLIPYRPYNAVTNPGGPAQYDLNVAYPFDLSGKRAARVNVACAASRVVEALYQDAVRLEVDRVGDAYVNALSARLTLRSIKDGLARLEETRKLADAHPGDPRDAAALQNQIQHQRQTLVLSLMDAESTWSSSKRTLALLLNLEGPAAAGLDLHGTIRDVAPPPPPVDELVGRAMSTRPDLAAYRLGLTRAQADVRLTQANRLPDVFGLYQPFTYQDNSPFNLPSSTSWAAGATVTVPLFDRNQGNIRRAQVNVDQSQLELQAVENRVASEVRGVYEEYLSTKRALDYIEREMLPGIQKGHDESLHRFRDGSLDAGTYFSVRRDLDDLGKQYRDLLVRHRRSMLDLNTAVGTRVLP